jgi:hypothetical protein
MRLLSRAIASSHSLHDPPPCGRHSQLTSDISAPCIPISLEFQPPKIYPTELPGFPKNRFSRTRDLHPQMMAGASRPAPLLKCCLHPRSSRVQHPYQPPGVAGEACFYPPTPALLLQRQVSTQLSSVMVVLCRPPTAVPTARRQ